ncbi:MAG: DUF3576 domain-containing protein [bacterium]|nr:DUF3576 domain-containing protein [bacterium]
MRFSVGFLLITLCLVGCESAKITQDDSDQISSSEQRFENMGELFGPDTLRLGGGRSASTSANPSIGVNVHLWRGTLEALSFMPLRLVDPFGGVVSTDWYEAPETPGERLKADVRILSVDLRADGISLSLFRQVWNNASKSWKDAEVSPDSVRKLEDVILTQARLSLQKSS